MKIFILFFNLLCFVAYSQPQIQWQRAIGGSGRDDLSGIIALADGGSIISGDSSSGISGDKNENSNGSIDCWILRLDANKQIIWQRTIGGSEADGIADAVLTSDGGIFLGAYSASDISGDKTENSRGYTDYWLLKLDAVGNIQWQRTIGGDGNENLTTVIQTTDGGYFIGGASNSGISGEKTEAARPGTFTNELDYWVLKLDANGTIEWQRTLGGSNDDYLYAAKQTPDGGYILAGISRSAADFDKTDPSRGGDDYWIIKLDATGTIEWQRTIGGDSEELLENIVITNDNGYLLAGSSMSGISGDKTIESKGTFDIWLVKLDQSGTMMWQKVLGGAEGDFVYAALQDHENNFLLAADSDSNISGDKSENSRGLSDMWIIKTNQAGDLIWEKTIGGSDNDGAKSVVQLPDNSFLIAGNSYSPISGDKTEATRGNLDYWIIKLRPDELSVTDFGAASDIKLFPNPAFKKFIIDFDGTIKSGSITVFDTFGKKLHTQNFKNTTSLDMELSIQAGIYYLDITFDDGNKKTLKLITR